MNSCKCFKSFFYFVFWHNMDNNILRLLIVFFIGMFCKLVGVLQITKYEIDTRNVTSIICCRGACSAWSKLLKQPYIYGNHWHYVTKRALLLSKISPHKNDTSQLTQLTYIATYIIIAIDWFSEIPEAADVLQNRCS